MKSNRHDNITGFGMMATVLILLATLRAVSCAAIDGIDDYDHFDSLSQLGLYEGTECKTKAGENGICRQIVDCDVYIDRLRNKTMKYKSIVRCSFIRFTEVICCPLDESLKSRSKPPVTTNEIPTTGIRPTSGPVTNNRPSQAACREWKQLDPANLDVHILNGTPVKPGVFAHMGALIQPVQSGGREQFVVRCGGSLINERYVLTAAHCVSDELLLPTFVRFGAVIWNSEESTPVDVDIQDIIMHDEYRAPVKYHDIAILRLVRNVEFSILVRPACLYADMADVDPSKQLIVIGWGVTNTSTRAVSDILLMTNLTTVPLSGCNRSHLEFGVSRNYKNGLDLGQYCAFDVKMDNDACEADSGGPLQLVEDGETKIVAIVSFGHLCGTALPAVYARVAFYLDWIESVVWPS